MATNRLRLILAVSGASGSVLARSLLRKICASDQVGDIHLVMSDAARRVAAEELGTRGTSADIASEWLGGVERRAEVVLHPARDIGASIASGSFTHDGMVVVPCSTATLGAIAQGVSTHLIHRAAECTLKERRRLVLVVRETPLSLIHLRNMVAVTEAGAVVMPPCPPYYHLPRTTDDIVDDTIARVLDHIGLGALVERRWQGQPPKPR